MKSFKIDISMPVFNAELYLDKSLNSVLKQTYKNFKLYVIDDCSKDSSWTIIKKFMNIDNRVIGIKLNKNKGMSYCLNKVNQISNADYIARIDCDDIMESNRIEEQINFLREYPDTVVLSSTGKYINDQDEILGKIPNDYIDHNKIIEKFKKSKPVALLHPSVTYNRKKILEVGGYRGEYWPSDDIDLWARLLEKNYKIRVQNLSLIRYRVHFKSAVSSKFIENRQKYRWVEECIKLRKKNKRELSFAEFKKLNKITINQYRKDLSKFYLRKGGILFYNSKLKIRLNGMSYLLISLLLDPLYFLTKIKKYFF